MSGDLTLYTLVMLATVLPVVALAAWAVWLGARRVRWVGVVGGCLLLPTVYFVLRGGFYWLQVLDVLSNPNIDPVELPRIAYEGFMSVLNCPMFGALFVVFPVGWLAYWTGRLRGGTPGCRKDENAKREPPPADGGAG